MHPEEIKALFENITFREGGMTGVNKPENILFVTVTAGDRVFAFLTLNPDFEAATTAALEKICPEVAFGLMFRAHRLNATSTTSELAGQIAALLMVGDEALFLFEFGNEEAENGEA